MIDLLRDVFLVTRASYFSGGRISMKLISRNASDKKVRRIDKPMRRTRLITCFAKKLHRERNDSHPEINPNVATVRKSQPFLRFRLRALRAPRGFRTPSLSLGRFERNSGAFPVPSSLRTNRRARLGGEYSPNAIRHSTASRGRPRTA